MHVTITVKLQAQSEAELTNTLAATAKKYTKHCEKLHKDGVFGNPADVTLRYLYVADTWKAPQEEPEGQS